MNQERTIRSCATLIITETYSGGYQRYKACQELKSKTKFPSQIFRRSIIRTEIQD